MTRVKSTFRTHHFNDGVHLTFDESKRYEIDYSRRFYIFNVIPIGKPRMTQRDKWRTNPHHIDPNKIQRKCVTEWFVYKNSLLDQAKKMDFVLGNALDCIYLIPMPASWSKKKKERMNGLPVKVKPDTDNITKGVKDTFCKNDSHIWFERCEKRWAYMGSIIIYQ